MKKLVIFLTLLFAAATLAQDLPRIAVYVTGDMGENEKRILATSMLNAFVRSGRYMGVENANFFLAEIDSERTKLSDSTVMNDRQISAIGERFGAGFVCIADATPALGEYHISARIVNTETSAVVSIGESHGPLRTMNDLALFADELVKDMLGRQARPVPQPVAVVPVPVPIPPPVVHTPPSQETVSAQSEQTRPGSRPVPVIGPVFPSESTPTPVVVHVPPPPETIPVVPVPAVETPPPAPSIPPGITPVIGIYITSVGGGVAARAVTPLVANGLTNALGGGGRFSTANRTNDINRLLGGPQDGALSERQMKNIADQLGIHYLCIVKIIFGAGGSFSLEVQLANAAAGSTVTTINLQDLNRSTIAKAMLDTGRELLAVLTEMSGVAGVAPAAGAASAQPAQQMGQLNRTGGDPSAPKESKKGASIGFGGFYSSDRGGGIRWDGAREQVIMPYRGGGGYVFLDAVYMELFFGFSGGGGEWRSNNVTNFDNLPYMSRGYMNLGIFGKLPLSSSNPQLFVLSGIEYESLMSGNLQYENANNDQRFQRGELSALWFKFGVGLDVDLSQGAYLRFESLYGIRTANKFEKDIVRNESWSAETRGGHGLTLKTGIGFRF